MAYSDEILWKNDSCLSLATRVRLLNSLFREQTVTTHVPSLTAGISVPYVCTDGSTPRLVDKVGGTMEQNYLQ